ncbi:MAG: hypothetical protein RL180_284, partial [Pseudomonadota bacterium]
MPEPIAMMNLQTALNQVVQHIDLT